VPEDWTHCPHCGQFQRFPNVNVCERASETEALQNRYQSAVDSAAQRKYQEVVAVFELAVDSSRAVMNCTVEKLLPLVTNLTDIYATFYQLEMLRARRSRTSVINWNTARPKAEIEITGSGRHPDALHYACLSLDGIGLSIYGELAVELRPNMIGHRSSIFQENTAVFFETHRSNDAIGLRSTWPQRGKLSVAKLAGEFDAATTPADFPKLLLREGTTSLDDIFVEVQIFGPMTLYTFAEVRLQGGTKTASSRKKSASTKAHLSAFRDKLSQANVLFVEE
jgi:hypothetical protein